LELVWKTLEKNPLKPRYRERSKLLAHHHQRHKVLKTSSTLEYYGTLFICATTVIKMELPKDRWAGFETLCECFANSAIHLVIDED
jgi:hypothetical protein